MGVCLVWNISMTDCVTVSPEIGYGQWSGSCTNSKCTGHRLLYLQGNQHQ